MTPVSLPSLRFDRMIGPFSLRAVHLPQLSSKVIYLKRFDDEEDDASLPALAKQQETDAMPQAPYPFVSRPPALAWRSSLTSDQAAAIAIAQQEAGYASPRSGKIQPLWSSSPSSGTTAQAAEDWKKARRKEQCRINQANYRKRKRQYEQKVASEIAALEEEIAQLQAHRDFAQGNPIQSMGDFYFAVDVKSKREMRPIRGARDKGPTLHCLLDLEREEFESVDALKVHWLWYREQFRRFQLSITSCERLEAGEHVIIRVAGELQLQVYDEDARQQERESHGLGVFTCPITQQFEFETGDQVITRITSEVDLIGGIAAALDECTPDRILSVLHYLSEGFVMSNRCLSN
ncbi:hypothetical protein PsorP6_018204 [Peronosclerospora sorghi]|uniref:Uncharacterized protein n=1 Tax=Peronosclerospora sorghi TaxID=230839 RepID=A0ACC0WDF4_9STRA|nr:hypothetical protein PsorP6_018204 [Peronosclerospora sorghi]